MNHSIHCSYEMALLRVIGLRNHSVGFILITQVLLFTIPGIIAGTLMSMGLYAILALVLNRCLFLTLPLLPPTSSFILSITVGFLVPVIAVIPPIISLFKKRLVDSLDYQHSVYILCVSH